MTQKKEQDEADLMDMSKDEESKGPGEVEKIEDDLINLPGEIKKVEVNMIQAQNNVDGMSLELKQIELQLYAEVSSETEKEDDGKEKTKYTNEKSRQAATEERLIEHPRAQQLREEIDKHQQFYTHQKAQLGFLTRKWSAAKKRADLYVMKLEFLRS